VFDGRSWSLGDPNHGLLVSDGLIDDILGSWARKIVEMSVHQAFHVSLGWFKGKFTGNHGFYHQI
jgi:hypothetical protein